MAGDFAIVLSIVTLVVTMPLMGDLQSEPVASCTVQTLPTRGLEGSVGRIECSVSGAPDTETRFTVHLAAAQEDTTTREFCTAELVDGVGACTGLLRDLSSFISGELTLVATLEPSGTQLPIAPPDAES